MSKREERSIFSIFHQIVMICLSLLSSFLPGGASFVQAAELPKTHTNSIGMEFVLIPAGEFLIGSDKLKDPNTGCAFCLILKLFKIHLAACKAHGPLVFVEVSLILLKRASLFTGKPAVLWKLH
ncbi:MAG: hypothetical protein LBJ14_06805 [Desulfarculales bacterium]|jgi:hypothetical protein|nr:hypothetical protein [Desulfarculales bacterium]